MLINLKLTILFNISFISLINYIFELPAIISPSNNLYLYLIFSIVSLISILYYLCNAALLNKVSYINFSFSFKLFNSDLFIYCSLFNTFNKILTKLSLICWFLYNDIFYFLLSVKLIILSSFNFFLLIYILSPNLTN